jgi:signal peptidase I
MKVLTRQTGTRNGFIDTARAVLEALIIALLIRTFLFQPFSIPSASMEPTLLVGDYLFVSKFTYGYSRYAFPFSPPLFAGRIFATDPQRGDVVVFRLPRDDSVDYVKRIIGLPGDRIQLIDGTVSINGAPVRREHVADFVGENPCGPGSGASGQVRVEQWLETLPNGVSYDTLKCASFRGFPDTTGTYIVPPGHYFMMGDNREDSLDSRFPQVGYVPFDHIVGRVQTIFFSLAGQAPAWQLWRWPWSVRWDRLLTMVR